MNLLADSGLRFGLAVQEARVAIKDVQIFSALVRGDFEGMRKAAEALPFGLGEIVKELSGPVDAAAKAIVFRLKGLTEDAYDPAATARAEKDRAAQVKAFNAGNKAIAEAEGALRKAALSAREYAKAEVDGMGLGADQAERLLALKLRLIEVDEQRKEFAQRQAVLGRGEDLIGQAMDQYAKATMSERDFIAYEVKHMGLAENHAESLLGWRLAILDATERQREAEAKGTVERDYAASLAHLREEAGLLRGTLDPLQADLEKAGQGLTKALEDGLLTFREYADRMENLRAALKDVQKAREEAAVKAEGERLTESVRTPEEKAKAEIERYKQLRAGGSISQKTYSRAVRKSLEDAALALPDVARSTVGVRGTFNAMEAAGLGAGGVTDRIAQASEKTAKNTEKIALLAAQWGVTFN
jgi:hypothetical protein